MLGVIYVEFFLNVLMFGLSQMVCAVLGLYALSCVGAGVRI
jgi:hypothetical protein